MLFRSRGGVGGRGSFDHHVSAMPRSITSGHGSSMPGTGPGPSTQWRSTRRLTSGVNVNAGAERGANPSRRRTGDSPRRDGASVCEVSAAMPPVRRGSYATPSSVSRAFRLRLCEGARPRPEPGPGHVHHRASRMVPSAPPTALEAAPARGRHRRRSRRGSLVARVPPHSPRGAGAQL